MQQYREFLVEVLADDSDNMTPLEQRQVTARGIVEKLTDQEVARTYLALHKLKDDAVREGILATSKVLG